MLIDVMVANVINIVIMRETLSEEGFFSNTYTYVHFVSWGILFYLHIKI